MEENSRKTMREGVIREELNGVLHVGFELSEDEERSNWVSEFNVSVRDNSTLLVGVGVGVGVGCGVKVICPSPKDGCINGVGVG